MPREIETEFCVRLSVEYWSLAQRVSISDFVVDAGTLTSEVGDERLRRGNLVQDSLRNLLRMFNLV